MGRYNWRENPPTFEEFEADVRQMKRDGLLKEFDVDDGVIQSCYDDMLEQASRPSTYVLYRFFDAGRDLLYVGITDSITTRWSDHKRDKTWFKDIVYATLEHFDTRSELRDAEFEAIQLEAPRYNIQGTGIRHRIQRPKPIRKPKLPPRNLPLPTGRKGASVFGSDANFFRLPHNLASEEPPEPEPDPEPFEWQTIVLGCPTCSSDEFFRIQTEGFDGQPQDRAVCEGCGRQSEFADYVAVAARLGQLGEAA